MKKNINVYLDSSFLIAYTHSNHEFNVNAVNIIRKIMPSRLYLSYLTIDETLYYMKDYFLNKVHIRENFEDLVKALEIEFIGVESNPNLVKKYLDLWISSNIKPRDAMHIFIMKQNGIKNIATFDSDFVKNKKELGINVI